MLKCEEPRECSSCCNRDPAGERGVFHSDMMAQVGAEVKEVASFAQPLSLSCPEGMPRSSVVRWTPASPLHSNLSAAWRYAAPDAREAA